MTRKAPFPGQGGLGSRERQSVWCCGVNYSRWRFYGHDFPGTHHTHCFKCGCELVWPEKKLQTRTATLRQEDRRRTFRAAYHRRAQRFLAQGLTTRGKTPTGGHGHVRLTPLEIAWKNLRAEMGNICVAEVTTGTQHRNEPT